MEIEVNTQDTNREVAATVGRTALIVTIIVLLIIGGGFGIWYLAFGQDARPETPIIHNPVSSAPSFGTSTSQETATPQPARSENGASSPLLAQPASIEEMFFEFTCPCCGKLIGDCSCGMAGERRGFVSGLVAAEQDRLGIYLAYADQYGLDSFASQEIRDIIREYKLAHAPAERPQIMLDPQQVNLGDVSTAAGKIETAMTIKNVGQSDLVIDGLSTSCGCTTVSVVNHGQEGPVFGAGTPPEDWSTAIRPGETAELKVYYDPSVHRDARGLMIREIYVSSNDPVDPVFKARIELNQVD